MASPLVTVLGILTDVLDLLTDSEGSEDTPDCALTVLPCRTAVYLGGEVPWDECGDGGCSGKDGMLWAKLISVDPTAGGSDQGNCPSYIWTAEIGIVRCIATLGEGSAPPSASVIEADAIRQAADADAIYTALRCCDARSEALREVALSRWNPLGPQGACAGGAWTVRGAFSVCC